MKSYRGGPHPCTLSYVSTAESLTRLRALGPIFRSKEAVAAGVSWRDLYRLRDVGEVIELSRGLFQLADAVGEANIDFVAICARAPHGMICLNSSLAYWDLSDEIPAVVHLAVPEGSRRPAIDHPPTRVHVFARRTFHLGRLRVQEGHGSGFWITDHERTVVDAFRLRHLVGEDLALGAARRYLSQQPRRARLAEVARQLGVAVPLLSALRIMEA